MKEHGAADHTRGTHGHHEVHGDDEAHQHDGVHRIRVGRAIGSAALVADGRRTGSRSEPSTRCCPRYRG